MKQSCLPTIPPTSALLRVHPKLVVVAHREPPHTHRYPVCISTARSVRPLCVSHTHGVLASITGSQAIFWLLGLQCQTSANQNAFSFFTMPCLIFCTKMSRNL